MPLIKREQFELIAEAQPAIPGIAARDFCVPKALPPGGASTPSPGNGSNPPGNSGGGTAACPLVVIGPPCRDVQVPGAPPGVTQEVCTLRVIPCP